MKRRMKLKSTLGKISYFLRGKKQGNHKGATSSRTSVREIQGRRSAYPNSTKLGAGDITARRRNPASIFRKRSHQPSNRVIRSYEKNHGTTS